MTVTLPLTPVRRHPAWFLPLLLPVLPALGALLPGPSWSAYGSSGALVLLVVLGIAAASAVPSLVEGAAAPLRKEALLLRDAWLASLFVVQVPLLAMDTLGGVEWMTYAASCTFLAAIPFGMEFQQGTLAALISAPVDRLRWWRWKHSALGVALGIHAAAFLLARHAVDPTPTVLEATIALAIPLTAWATTSLWTFLGRGLLPGIAFSLAVPTFALALGSSIPGWLAALTLPDLIGPEEQLALQLGVLALATPAYAAFGFRQGWRQWARYEASEVPLDAFASLPMPSARASASAERRRRPASLWRWRLRAELRIHAVTLGLLGATALLAAGTRGFDEDTLPGALARVGLMLLGTTTLVLAGATGIAEERRLGTWASQLLQPQPRWTLGALKLGVGAVLAAAAGLLLLLALGSAGAGPLGIDLREAWVGAWLVAALFLIGFHASSGSSNPLRAGVTALVVVFAAGALLGVTLAFGAEIHGRIQHAYYTSAASDDARWRAEATALSETDWEALRRNGAEAESRAQFLLPALQLVLGLPLLLAVVFALRNLAQPGDASRKLPRQILGGLGLLAGLAGAALVATAVQARAQAHALTLANVRSYLELEARFSPVDRRLRETFGRDPFVAFVTIPMTPQPGRDTRPNLRGFHLPLDARSRRILLHQGEVDDVLRDALRQEALARGEDITPPPPEPVATPGSFFLRRVPGAPPMPPGLFRRYGIFPTPALPPPPGPPPGTPPVP